MISNGYFNRPNSFAEPNCSVVVYVVKYQFTFPLIQMRKKKARIEQKTQYLNAHNEKDNIDMIKEHEKRKDNSRWQ